MKMMAFVQLLFVLLVAVTPVAAQWDFQPEGPPPFCPGDHGPGYGPPHRSFHRRPQGPNFSPPRGHHGLRPPHGPGFGPPPQGPRRNELEQFLSLADSLDLTDEQLISLRKKMKSDKKEIQSLKEKLRSLEKQIMEALNNEAFDETKLREILAMKAKVMTELEIKRLKKIHLFRQGLDPKQKEKAKLMFKGRSRPPHHCPNKEDKE